MLKVAKAVIKKDDKYLLVRRADASPVYPGRWDFSGGRLEPGETPAEAVVREVREETTLEIIPGGCVKEGEYLERPPEFQAYYFEPSEYHGAVSLSSEHSEFAWLSIEDITRLGKEAFHPAVPLYFEFFK